MSWTIRREKFVDLWQTLEDWPWRDTVRTLRQRFREDRLGLTAGSLTFTTLISLVPLLTVMLAVFSAFPMFSNFQQALEQYFLRSLVPEGISKPVLRSLTQFSASAHSLGAVGLIFLVLSAQALMLTIDRTLNAIWRVRKPRPIAQRVLVYWAAATLGPLFLGISLSLTSYAVSASRGLVGALPGGVAFLLTLIEVVMLTCGMAALFRYVPNTHVRWRHAFTGAFVAVLGFQLAKRMLGWYLGSVDAYQVIYGAFAAVPIFLVWIFLSWVIVLLGAVIAAYTPSLQMKVVRHADVAGAPFQLAVAVLRLLATARAQPGHGLSLEALSTRLRIDPLQIEPALDVLVRLDWVARLDEEGSARYTLICEPAATPAAPLLRSLLLAPLPELLGFWHQAGFEDIRLQALLES
ncbi:MAG: YihY family inner membrane protein [Pseudomonadota bacterium]